MCYIFPLGFSPLFVFNTVLLGKENIFFFFTTNFLSGVLMSLTDNVTNSSNVPARLEICSADYCTSKLKGSLSPKVY